MFLAYYDESGDDGFPNYSSPLFVLTALYMHYFNWKKNYDKIHLFRKQIKEDFGLPIKTEFHTKYFLLNKHPYRDMNFSDLDRIKLIDLFCELISELEVIAVNVVINKIKIKSTEYRVLDTALTYSVQRIENDLKIDPTKKFILITDTGRVAKMRKTTRKVQRFNYIPSKYGRKPYREEIKALIEDPLPKDSNESYFIQVSDLIAYVVYLYMLDKLKAGNFPNRMPKDIDKSKVIDWMDRLRSIFNLKAASSNPYGIVCYPK